jgi:PKD repeat protein
MRVILVFIFITLSTSAFSIDSYISIVWSKKTVDTVSSLKFTKDGKYLFSNSVNSSLSKWDLSTSKLITEFGSLPINSDYDPDNEVFYSNYSPNSIVRTNLNSVVIEYSKKFDLSWTDNGIIYHPLSSNIKLCPDNSKLFLFHSSVLYGPGLIWGNGGGLVCINSLNGDSIYKWDKNSYNGIISRTGNNLAYRSYFGWGDNKGHTTESYNVNVNRNLIRTEWGNYIKDSSKNSDLKLFSFANNERTFLGFYSSKMTVWSSQTGFVINNFFTQEIPKDAKYSIDDSLIYLLFENELSIYKNDGQLIETIILGKNESNCLAICPKPEYFAVGFANGTINVYKNAYYSDSLIVNFKTDTLEGTDSLTVNFNDISAGMPDRFLWDFGDGSQSTERNPVHIYKSPGLYTVKLIISKGVKSDTLIKSDFIKVYEYLKADFIADTVYGFVPLSVRFYDKSLKNPTKWIWDFGDGDYSYEQNPVHDYSKPGLYNVKLTVENETNKDSIVKVGFIEILSEFKCEFSISGTSGKAPYQVRFYNLSKGNPESYIWDFGDGSKSNISNPIHYYDIEGTYDVRLLISKGKYKDSTIKVSCIKVLQPDNFELSVVKSVTAHNDNITDVKYSRDGKQIATAGNDSTIRFWNSDKLVLENEIRFGSPVFSIYFSRDSKHFFLNLIDTIKDSLQMKTCLFSYPDLKLIKEIIHEPIRKSVYYNYAIFDENPLTNEIVINFQYSGANSEVKSQYKFCNKWNIKEDSFIVKNGYNYFYNCNADNYLSIFYSRGISKSYNPGLFWSHNERHYYIQGSTNHKYYDINQTFETDNNYFLFEEPLICKFSDFDNKLLLSNFDSNMGYPKKMRILVSKIDGLLSHVDLNDISNYMAECVIFDRTGRYIICVDLNGEMFLINTDNWKIFRKIIYPQEINNWKMDYSPVKYQFVTSSSDGVLRIWKYDDGNLFSTEPELEINEILNVKPNPAGDYIEIDLERCPTSARCWTSDKVRIYNSIGECVMESAIHTMTASHRMNVESLSPGIYFLRCGGQTTKFVKM